MEMDRASQADAGETPAPSGVGHLDFGSRDGAGVVGPRLDPAVSREKSADRFEVKEGAHDSLHFSANVAGSCGINAHT